MPQEKQIVIDANKNIAKKIKHIVLRTGDIIDSCSYSTINTI